CKKYDIRVVEDTSIRVVEDARTTGSSGPRPRHKHKYRLRSLLNDDVWYSPEHGKPFFKGRSLSSSEKPDGLFQDAKLKGESMLTQASGTKELRHFDKALFRKMRTLTSGVPKFPDFESGLFNFLSPTRKEGAHLLQSFDHETLANILDQRRGLPEVVFYRDYVVDDVDEMEVEDEGAQVVDIRGSPSQGGSKRKRMHMQEEARDDVDAVDDEQERQQRKRARSNSKSYDSTRYNYTAAPASCHDGTHDKAVSYHDGEQDEDIEMATTA
ncbi:unnamed protein product, partial [Amoebophrya sp. A25]